jgi:pimeloyl-ACP methyl ester carboxylesterase
MIIKGIFGLVVGFVLVVAVSYVKALRNEARARADFPADGQLVDVDGQTVHVVQMGLGPDVVLIHGSGGNTRDMDFGLAPALAQNFRVTVIDRPGHGHTPAISPTGDTLADQARLLAQAAQKSGVERPIVLGHSFGGAVALAWALDNTLPPSALVILAGASNPWNTPLPGLYQATSHPVFGGLVRMMLSAWVSQSYIESSIVEVFSPQPAPNGYRDYIASPLILRRSALRANALQRRNLLDQIITQAPQYGSITIPVEILHGTADQTVAFALHADPLSHQIPQSVLMPLPGIGHMPHHSALDETVAAVLRAADHADLR